MMGIWKLEYKTLHLGHLGDEFPYPQCILRMIFPLFPVKQPCNHLHDSPFPAWLLVLWEQPPHSRFVSRSWVGEKYPRQCEKLLHLQHKNWHEGNILKTRVAYWELEFAHNGWQKLWGSRSTSSRLFHQPEVAPLPWTHVTTGSG